VISFSGLCDFVDRFVYSQKNLVKKTRSCAFVLQIARVKKKAKKKKRLTEKMAHAKSIALISRMQHLTSKRVAALVPGNSNAQPFVTQRVSTALRAGLYRRQKH
jgi:hypothetical protein